MTSTRFKDLPTEDASFFTPCWQSLQSLDWINLGWFAGVVFALVLLLRPG